ncbi:MAG: sigma-70 family RNA polymerase sigma factor [Firmicutes bacterium]|nr:sigma-70 family RNA polymerase sigma factor [Bacillota bacterium]
MRSVFDGLSDEELAARAPEDPDAMDLLLHCYKDAVRAKAQLYFMMGGDRDDIIQEGMTGLFRAATSYDPSKGASFKTYADVCINRHIINAIKVAGRRKYSPLNTAYSLDRPVSDDSPGQTLGETLAAGMDSNPEASAILSEMTELIMAPDSRLFSSLERQVLQGLYEGLNYRQISVWLAKSPKQVDNAMQRIRKKLRAFFSE